MPVSIFQSEPLNIRPSIVGPSAGDLEEARIKRLIDLAHLRQLQEAPLAQRRAELLQSRGLDIQQANVTEGGRHNLVDEQLAADRLVQAAKEHEGTLKSQSEGYKAGVVQTLIGHAQQLGLDLNTLPSVLSKTLAKSGYPELSSAMAEHADEVIKPKVNAVLSNISKLPTQKQADALQALQVKDPNLHEAVMKQYRTPEIVPTLTSTPSIAPAPVASSPGYNPVEQMYNLLKKKVKTPGTYFGPPF
jgi:hypothetical protein